MQTPEPTVKAVTHWVSCLPEDDINAHSFTLIVRYKGAGRWMVGRGWTSDIPCMDADGEWSWGVEWEDGREPVGSKEIDAYNQARDAWLDAHRFDEETALRLAKEHAPKIVVNGWTVADALAKREARDA